MTHGQQSRPTKSQQSRPTLREALAALDPEAPAATLRGQLNALYTACKRDGSSLGELMALELRFSARANADNPEGLRKKARFLKFGVTL